MTLTRRQLGWWTAAALLTPSVALAGKPAAQQAATEPTTVEGLEALSYSLEVVERTGDTLTFALHVTNAGHQPLSALVSVARVQLLEDGTAEHGFGWVNDAHPFSRRMIAPAWVDVPADRTLALAQVHVMGEPAPGRTAKLTITITDEKGRSTQLTPAPFSLGLAVGETVSIGEAERSTS